MSSTILIQMSAQLTTPPYTYVYWNCYNEPDYTATYSGYALNQLMNIGVASINASGSPVNPLDLTVGGDLTGALPNPSVSGIQGNPISSTEPIAGQSLVYSGSEWVPFSGLSADGYDGITISVNNLNELQINPSFYGSNATPGTLPEYTSSGGLSTNNIIFEPNVAPSITQTTSSSIGNGSSLTIQAQNANGAGYNGGSVNILSGLGSGQAGSVNINCGGFNTASFSPSNITLNPSPGVGSGTVSIDGYINLSGFINLYSPYVTLGNILYCDNAGLMDSIPYSTSSIPGTIAQRDGYGGLNASSIDGYSVSSSATASSLVIRDSAGDGYFTGLGISGNITSGTSTIISPVSATTASTLSLAGGQNSKTSGAAVGGALNLTGGASTTSSTGNGGPANLTGGSGNLIGGSVNLSGGSGGIQGSISVSGNNITTSSLLATDGANNLTSTTSGLSPSFKNLTLAGTITGATSIDGYTLNNTAVATSIATRDSSGNLTCNTLNATAITVSGGGAITDTAGNGSFNTLTVNATGSSSVPQITTATGLSLYEVPASVSTVSGTGNSINIQGGSETAASGTNYGGNVNITGGTVSGGTSNAGYVTISGGTGNYGSPASITVYGGQYTLGGNIALSASTSINVASSAISASSLLATDGSSNITSTTSGLSPSFTGLTLSGNVTTGTSTTISPASATTAKTLSIAAGANSTTSGSTTGGLLSLTGGAATATSGNGFGGAVTITGGAGFTAGAGGNVNLVGGPGPTQGYINISGYGISGGYLLATDASRNITNTVSGLSPTFTALTLTSTGTTLSLNGSSATMSIGSAGAALFTGNGNVSAGTSTVGQTISLSGGATSYSGSSTTNVGGTLYLNGGNAVSNTATNVSASQTTGGSVFVKLGVGSGAATGGNLNIFLYGATQVSSATNQPSGCVLLNNCSQAPTGAVSNGVILYASGGVLYVLDSGGTAHSLGHTSST